jgi:hypothetical protein
MTHLKSLAIDVIEPTRVHRFAHENRESGRKRPCETAEPRAKVGPKPNAKVQASDKLAARARSSGQ